MFFSPRMSAKPLAFLCRRLATALMAGIDVRTVWAREAQHARGRAARQHLAAISRAVNQGESLAAALAATGDFFPLLFREMAEVGEQSGHLGEVFAQLAEHYENQVHLRRNFLAAIAWPMLQLAIALAVVGFLIWITGIIGQMTGTTVDILGFGLVGNRGLAIYVALGGRRGWRASGRYPGGKPGTDLDSAHPRGVLRLPVLGPALQTLALARLAWSMHLTMNAGMELRRALRLSLRSTRNVRYTTRSSRSMRRSRGGNSIYEAFYASRLLSRRFSRCPCRSASRAASSSSPWPTCRGSIRSKPAPPWPR